MTLGPSSGTFVPPASVGIVALDADHAGALPDTTPPAADDLARPLAEREAPVACDEDAADEVDDLDEEGEEPGAALLDSQENGLNVVLEEEARNGALAHLVRLLRHGVLVGVNCVAR